MTLRSSVAAASLALALPGIAAAHDSCAPIVDAFAKAALQRRLAQYLVQNVDAPAVGRPVWIRIENLCLLDRGGGYEGAAVTGEMPVLARLKQAIKDQRAKCVEVSRGAVRGVAAIQYRFDDRIAADTVHKWVLWVGTVSGLPLYNEIENLGGGGFAWVYGDAVAEPRMVSPAPRHPAEDTTARAAAARTRWLPSRRGGLPDRT
jgi:hypothetical protein